MVASSGKMIEDAKQWQSDVLKPQLVQVGPCARLRQRRWSPVPAPSGGCAEKCGSQGTELQVGQGMGAVWETAG